MIKALKKALKLIANKRGDLNLQYAGLAAMTIGILAVVLLVGAAVTGRFNSLIERINALTF